jgi:hypothetical protein
MWIELIAFITIGAVFTGGLLMALDPRKFLPIIVGSLRADQVRESLNSSRKVLQVRIVGGILVVFSLLFFIDTLQSYMGGNK